MSLDIETKTEQTVAGEVKYESVTCEHCGYDTALENARVAIFPRSTYKNYSHGGNNWFKVEYASDADQYAFCPDCADSLFGPEQEGNYQNKLDQFIGKRETRFLLVAAVHILLMAFAIIGLVVILGALF